MQQLPRLTEAEFLALPAGDLVALVQRYGPRTVAMPVNGTRRWFILEKGLKPGDDYAQVFVDAIARETARLIELVLGTGVTTLATPVYGTDLARRGDAYVQMATQALSLLAGDDYRRMYQDLGARVRFYGDYARWFADHPALLAALRDVEEETASYERHLLLYGICGESATSRITEVAAKAGRALTDQEAIVAYYGVDAAPANIYVGFEGPCAFDIPLLDNGDVAIYSTVAPTPYLRERDIRAILYDWLYVRRRDDPDQGEVRAHEWEDLHRIYRTERGTILGRGHRVHGFWFPLSGSLPEVDFATPAAPQSTQKPQSRISAGQRGRAGRLFRIWAAQTVQNYPLLGGFVLALTVWRNSGGWLAAGVLAAVCLAGAVLTEISEEWMIHKRSFPRLLSRSVAANGLSFFVAAALALFYVIVTAGAGMSNQVGWDILLGFGVALAFSVVQIYSREHGWLTVAAHVLAYTVAVGMGLQGLRWIMAVGGLWMQLTRTLPIVVAASLAIALVDYGNVILGED